jgi:hypothetical protein
LEKVVSRGGEDHWEILLLGIGNERSRMMSKDVISGGDGGAIQIICAELG